MNWKEYTISDCGTHHIDQLGVRVYSQSFDEVLKYHEPGLAPVSRGGVAWHISCDGEPAYTKRFQRTFGFYEGLAAVVDFSEDNAGWRHIDIHGQCAYRESYHWCGNFQNGVCAVRDKTDGYFHIYPNGTACYPTRWRYAGDFRDGIAVVQSDDGVSTHIKQDGTQIHGMWFLDLDVFHKGFARARDHEGWMHIDSTGKPAYKRRFKAVEPFYNGQARVERFEGGLEIIDEQGAVVLELRPAIRSEFAALSADLVGFWQTQAIGAAVELGVFDALPAATSIVAEKCQMIPDWALRLLRALAQLQLVESREDTWCVTARGSFLRVDHEMSLSDAAIEYAQPMSSLWQQLPNALKVNSDWRAPDVFTEVANDGKRCQSHHRMLRSYARHDYPAVVKAINLDGAQHVIDAGGGSGELGRQIAESYPDCNVTVFDLPEVIRQHKQSDGVVSWAGGNLFNDWGVTGSAVVLARVLHDWDDDKALDILRRARSALSLSGKLYIIEMLLEGERIAGALCDLHLLVVTGGRERSALDYERLMKAAGFELLEIRNTTALPSIVVGNAV